MEGWGCAGWGSWGGSAWALIVAAVGRIVGIRAWAMIVAVVVGRIVGDPRVGDDCGGGGERRRSTEAGRTVHPRYCVFGRLH
jgi:hypothetical protein